MEYLNKVLIYLKQELPDNYKYCLMLNDERFVIKLNDGVDFNSVYGELQSVIINGIKRIINREIDLFFTVKNNYQERDFSILK